MRRTSGGGSRSWPRRVARPTVEGALRQALLARHVPRREHDRLRSEYASAKNALGRLTGVRRAELGAVVASVEALAASHRLTAGRFEPVFLVLRRNREFWTRTPTLPAAAMRTSFGRDPAVFQYYPGQGIQLQQLASWGKVNAKLGACRRHGARCPRARLRRSLERLVRLGSRRDRFFAWESYFSFGGGTPPWISGMTQGTAIQALARGSRVLGTARYLRIAEQALGAFRAPPPVGIAVDAPGGRHYLMYSFSPGLRILNGDLQAVTGLRDLAVLGPSRAARVLYRRGERAARRAVGGFDTGAWSLYSEQGRESTLGYHQLVGQFLGNLCERTRGRTYCSTEKRFARYEREPPKIHVAALNGLHARRTTSVRFSLSKVSTVAVRVSSPRGVTMSRRLALPRGSHTVAWTPPRRGRYRVRISAQGPSGPRGVRAETVRVVLPKPPKKKPRKKAERRREAEPRTNAERRREAERAARGEPRPEPRAPSAPKAAPEARREAAPERRREAACSAVVQAGDLAVAEGVHEAAVIVADQLAVGGPEVREVGGERLALVAHRLGDRLLGLEADERLVRAGVGHAVHLRGRLPEEAQQRGQLVEL